MVSLYLILNQSDFPKLLQLITSQMLMHVIVRLAGGPLVLPLQSDNTRIGLVIAALILLNVGLILLLVTTLGLIRLM